MKKFSALILLLTITFLALLSLDMSRFPNVQAQSPAVQAVNTNDGIDEIVVVNNAGFIDVYDYEGALVYKSFTGGWTRVATADLNDDSDEEIIAINNNSLTVYDPHVSGSTFTFTATYTGTGDKFVQVGTGNFINDDLTPEIALLFSIGNGQGRIIIYDPPSTTPKVDQAFLVDWHDFAIGDYDGDGDDDFALIAWNENNPSGSKNLMELRQGHDPGARLENSSNNFQLSDSEWLDIAPGNFITNNGSRAEWVGTQKLGDKVVAQRWQNQSINKIWGQTDFHFDFLATADFRNEGADQVVMLRNVAGGVSLRFLNQQGLEWAAVNDLGAGWLNLAAGNVDVETTYREAVILKNDLIRIYRITQSTAASMDCSPASECLEINGSFKGALALGDLGIPPGTAITEAPAFEARAILDPIAKKPGGGGGPVTPTLIVRNLGPGPALSTTVLLKFGRLSVSANDLYATPAIGVAPPFPAGPPCGDKCSAYVWTGPLDSTDVITFTTLDGLSTIGGVEGTTYTVTVVITASLNNMVTPPVIGVASGKITSHAHLNPIKSGPLVAGPGELMTYTITVENRGMPTDEPPSLWLVDHLPAGTTVANISDGGQLYPLTGTRGISWTLPALDSGERITRTVSVQINDDLAHGTQLINTDYQVHWYEDGVGSVFSETGQPVTTTVQKLLLSTMTFTASRDNTLYEDLSGALSNGAGAHVFAGKAGAGHLQRGLMAFVLAGQIPAGSTVVSASLKLNMSRTSAGAEIVTLHKLQADWGEGISAAGKGEGGGAAATAGDATWLHTVFNTATWTIPGGDFMATPSATQTVTGLGTYTWSSTPDLVSDVQGWLDSPATNFGWLLKGNESGTRTSKRFDSKDHSTPANHPLLIVTFAITPSIAPITDVTISGPTNGQVNQTYTFDAVVAPGDATPPITYTWMPEPNDGQGKAQANYTWPNPGTKIITVSAQNSAGQAEDTFSVSISNPCSAPLAGLTLLGSESGQVNQNYSFSAIISPTNATHPLTYTWSPEPVAGQGTAVATYVWPSAGLKTVSLSVANCGGAFSDTWTLEITDPPPAVSGDAYEADDRCDQAGMISPDATIQTHTFHQPGDVDWIQFQATAGITYIIEARVPPTSKANIDFQLYETCGDSAPEGQNNTFSSDIRYSLYAPGSDSYYLRLADSDATTYGPTIEYQLTVRAVEPAATKGAVIIVAGKRRENDPVQGHIHHVTDALYNLALGNGCTPADIHYLANDPTLPGVDAGTTAAALEQAITVWAKDKVGPDKPLTVYLMDHGAPNKFYLNGAADTVNPSTLNRWLSEVEDEKGAEVSLVIEACNAGSFITEPEQLSRAGRAVIASTGSADLAYASQQGAVFSDAFIDALVQGRSMVDAFEAARWVAEATNPDQQPQLDSNGNGLANETADRDGIAQRSFACAAPPAVDKWPPYIETVVLKTLSDGNVGLWATVKDDKAVDQVWAEVYPPSYRPPVGAEELVQTNLPPLQMINTNAEDIYGAFYPPLNEQGVYRVVIYARDEEGLTAQPKEILVGEAIERLHLPLIMK